MQEASRILGTVSGGSAEAGVAEADHLNTQVRPAGPGAACLHRTNCACIMEAQDDRCMRLHSFDAEPVDFCHAGWLSFTKRSQRVQHHYAHYRSYTERLTGLPAHGPQQTPPPADPIA